jgi:ribonucleotide monophosphatase NagD (HAD superfamily)
MDTKVAIVDIDGVIASNQERIRLAKFVAKLIAQSKGQESHENSIHWEIAFYPALVRLDTPLPGVSRALDMLKEKGYSIFLLTSRPETMRKETEQWLDQHDISIRGSHQLIMKDYTHHQFTKTHVWKAQAVTTIKERTNAAEVLFIDDEQVNRDAVMALGQGDIICKPNLDDYVLGDTDHALTAL